MSHAERAAELPRLDRRNSQGANGGSRNGHEEFLDLRGEWHRRARVMRATALAAAVQSRSTSDGPATRELSGTIELVSNGKVVVAQKGTAAGRGARWCLPPATTSGEAAGSARDEWMRAASRHIPQPCSYGRSGPGPDQCHRRRVLRAIYRQPDPQDVAGRRVESVLRAGSGRQRRAGIARHGPFSGRLPLRPGPQIRAGDWPNRAESVQDGRISSSSVPEVIMNSSRRAFLKSSIGAPAAAIRAPHVCDTFAARILRARPT